MGKIMFKDSERLRIDTQTESRRHTQVARNINQKRTPTRVCFPKRTKDNASEDQKIKPNKIQKLQEEVLVAEATVYEF